MEKELNGHMDLEEKKNKEGESQKCRVGILSHPEEDLDPPEENLLSGLDLVLNLEVSSEEILRRIRGRRMDPITKTLYHIEDNPAPLDIKGLNERLIMVNDEFSEGKNEGFYEKFKEGIEEMKGWYRKFVNINGKNVMQNIEGKGKFEVFEGIEKQVFGLLEKKQEEYEVLLGEKEKNIEGISKEGEIEGNDKFEVGNVDLESAKILWTLWDETQDNYLKEIYKTLRKFKENR